MLVFSKQKMLERLEREGRMNEVDEECQELMTKLDGLEAVRNDWKYVVHNELAYMVKNPDTMKWISVNKEDCIEK